MRKEVLFAILSGIILGLILAFGIWRANVALRSKTVGNQVSNSSQTQKDESNIGLTLASPENFQVVTEGTISISGITKPNIWVGISSDVDDFLIKTDNDGGFSQKISLAEGVNEVLITAFDEKTSPISSKLYLTFSSEFAKQIQTPTTTPKVTEQESSAASAVREKVEEKINQAKKVPIFFMGAITDKLENTIQIRDFQGEIKQISISPDEATFVKISKTRQDLKFSDLAIGDFIVALGYKNGNGVLNAKRILIVSEFIETERQIISGVVDSTRKADLTFAGEGTNTLIKNTRDISFLRVDNGQEKKVPFAEIKEGEKAVLFGSKTESGFSARSVYLID